MFLANQQFISCNFLLCCPSTEVSPQPSAIRGGNPLGDWQSAVGWGDAGFEPGTAGQQGSNPTLIIVVCPLLGSRSCLQYTSVFPREH